MLNGVGISTGPQKSRSPTPLQARPFQSWVTIPNLIAVDQTVRSTHIHAEICREKLVTHGHPNRHGSIGYPLLPISAP